MLILYPPIMSDITLQSNGYSMRIIKDSPYFCFYKLQCIIVYKITENQFEKVFELIDVPYFFHEATNSICYFQSNKFIWYSTPNNDIEFICDIPAEYDDLLAVADLNTPNFKIIAEEQYLIVSFYDYNMIVSKFSEIIQRIKGKYMMINNMSYIVKQIGSKLSCTSVSQTDHVKQIESKLLGTDFSQTDYFEIPFEFKNCTDFLFVGNNNILVNENHSANYKLVNYSVLKEVGELKENTEKPIVQTRHVDPVCNIQCIHNVMYPHRITPFESFVKADKCILCKLDKTCVSFGVKPQSDAMRTKFGMQYTIACSIPKTSQQKAGDIPSFDEIPISDLKQLTTDELIMAGLKLHIKYEEKIAKLKNDESKIEQMINSSITAMSANINNILIANPTVQITDTSSASTNVSVSNDNKKRQRVKSTK